MSKIFWALQPGDIGFKVSHRGRTETDWIVGGLHLAEQKVRIFKFDRNGNTLGKTISKDKYDKWQKELK